MLHERSLMPTDLSFLGNSLWITLLILLYPLTWLLIPWVLLKKVVHPSARIAWVLVILFVPYVGAVLAVVLGALETWHGAPA